MEDLVGVEELFVGIGGDAALWLVGCGENLGRSCEHAKKNIITKELASALEYPI